MSSDLGTLSLGAAPLYCLLVVTKFEPKQRALNPQSGSATLHKKGLRGARGEHPGSIGEHPGSIGEHTGSTQLSHEVSSSSPQR